MLLYCTTITPRLSYITDFIGKEISGEPIELTTDLQKFKDFERLKINYTTARITGNEFWLSPHFLLTENNIRPQQTVCFTFNNRKAFFRTEGDFAFDIFAASFYLLSRYEEYLPHQKDMYGRYDHLNSLAYKEGFLQTPLINYWLEDFKTELKKKFSSSLIDHPAANRSSFTFVPTYDIDMAWLYRNKDWWRRTGGIIRAMLKGNWKELKVRTSKGIKDPYDAYGWMNQLHERHKIKPYYFFLVAARTSRYDKNISPRNKAMKALICDHAIRYPVGIHPSWRSGDQPDLLKKEIDTLSMITGTNILSSRQHYIRFTLPETFRRLIENGIQFDFSMGYGGINGFRASTATPFYWFDLSAEQKTPLFLFPYCYMDANSFYEQKLSAKQALEEMKHYYEEVKAVNGTFIMIWHNSFLGTDPVFAGWREAYETFIRSLIPRASDDKEELE